MMARQRLRDEFSENGNQTILLRALMLMAATGCQQISVVCVGVGDAFFRYWEKLQQLVNRGRIKLTLADVKSLADLRDQRVQEAREAGRDKDAELIESRYNSLQAAIDANPNSIQFLDKDDKDKARYQHLTAHIVFILVPDNVHIREALPWLHRTVLILIEKPFNRNVEEADQFEQKLRDLVSKNPGGAPFTIVVGIDHYLAKIEEYLKREESDDLLKRIGGVQQIEFRLLEAQKVEAWRQGALAAGMSYDLYVHVQAMIANHVDLRSFTLDSERTCIRAAKHHKSPIGGEDYMWIDTVLANSQGGEVRLTGAVGKGVGTRDEKYLVFVGKKGKLYFQLDRKQKGGVYLLGQGQSFPGVDGTGNLCGVGEGHPEMLDALFDGRFIEEPVGGLPGEVAIKILENTRQIRDQIASQGVFADKNKYEPGTSVEEINKIATVIVG